MRPIDGSRCQSSALIHISPVTGFPCRATDVPTGLIYLILTCKKLIARIEKSLTSSLVLVQLAGLCAPFISVNKSPHDKYG